MADNSLPPLPPGFELEDQQQIATAHPPLPAGFELVEDEEPGLEIDIVGGTPVSNTDYAQMREKETGGFARDVGMGARSVIQGAGGLLGALGGDAFNHYITPGDQPSYRDAAGGLADRMGLPRPQTSQERVMGDVGEALTGTGLTMGAGGLLNAGRNAVSAAPTITSRLGDLLTTQPKLQALSAATGAGASGATREGGGGAGAQALAGLAGGLTPGVASAATGAGLRGLIRGRSGEQTAKNLADFQSVGASPSLGQATGNRLVQGAENLLGGAPTSAGVMGRFVENQASDIGEGLQSQASSLFRNASGERAGRAVEAGVDLASKNIGAVRKALYWRADGMVPANTGTPLTNTVRSLTDLTTPNAGAATTTGRLVNPQMKQMLADLQADLQANGGKVSYEALRKIRTSIGEKMNDFSMTQDTPARQLSALYSSLSRDMEDVARGIGPDALQAARRANTYTRVSSDRLKIVQQVVDKNGGPEKVYNAVMAGTKDGATTLRAVLRSLPMEGKKAVTGAVIKRMGMATPGNQGAEGAQFSAQTLLTNWNNISKEARSALFDGYGPSFSRDMDRVARVAENIRNGAKIYANPSGTANRAASFTYGAALLGSMIDPSLSTTGALVGSGVAANYLARKLTNPAVVKWFANATAMPTGSAVSQIHALRRIGEKQQDEEIVQAADALLEQERNKEPGGKAN